MDKYLPHAELFLPTSDSLLTLLGTAMGLVEVVE